MQEIEQQLMKTPDVKPTVITEGVLLAFFSTISLISAIVFAVVSKKED